MSKSLKNYPDPNEVINQYGADATRYVSVKPTIDNTLISRPLACSSLTLPS